MVVVLPPRCMLKRNVCLLQVHCQVVSQCICFYYFCLLYHTIISFVQEYIIPVCALYTEGVCVHCECAIGVFALLHTCKKPLQSTCYAICLSVWLNRHHHKCATGFSVSLSVWKALQQTKRTNSQTVPTTAHSILLTLILCVCVFVSHELHHHRTSSLQTFRECSFSSESGWLFTRCLVFQTIGK